MTYLNGSDVIGTGSSDAEHSGAVGIVEVRVVHVPESGSLKQQQQWMMNLKAVRVKFIDRIKH